MIVFWTLLGLFGIIYLISFTGIGSSYLATHQAKARLALGLWFIAAGTLHFTATGIEIVMMPAFLPFKVALMYISGAAEILGGIGLLIPRVQRAAGIGLIALLVFVFPANINVALNHITGPGLINDPVQQWIRLPLQFVLIGLLYWAAIPAVAQPVARISLSSQS